MVARQTVTRLASTAASACRRRATRHHRMRHRPWQLRRLSGLEDSVIWSFDVRGDTVPQIQDLQQSASSAGSTMGCSIAFALETPRWHAWLHGAPLDGREEDSSRMRPGDPCIDASRSRGIRREQRALRDGVDTRQSHVTPPHSPVPRCVPSCFASRPALDPWRPPRDPPSRAIAERAHVRVS